MGKARIQHRSNKERQIQVHSQEEEHIAERKEDTLKEADTPQGSIGTWTKRSAKRREGIYD